jgi:Fe-S oxidoreductase
MSEGKKEIKIATGDRAILPEGTRLVSVYIMGKRYMVPETLTIQKAIEYAGYQFIRACGCRGGICGACPTVYRIMGDYHLYFGLACQTVVQENMILTQMPFFPANRASYNLEEIEPTAETLMQLYPEIMKCVACNTCTKACPMDIEVMEYVNAAMRGDIAKVARLSFDCIQCGLCAMRCPAEITHYHVAQLARRLYGRTLPVPRHVLDRVEEIESGKYEEEFEKLLSMSREELEELYRKEQREKGGLLKEGGKE